MKVPALTAKNFIVTIPEKPVMVISGVFAQPSEHYVIHYRCMKCKAPGRLENSQCWQCKAAPNESMTEFTVKLADNGVEARGLLTFLLSRWNPCLLKCHIKDQGASTQIEMTMKNQISPVETIILSTAFALLAFAVVGNGGNWFTWIIAFFLFPIWPLALVRIRKIQASRLSEFATSYLPETFPRARIENRGTPFG